MAVDIPLPRFVGWFTRAVLYSIAFFAFYGILYFLASFRLSGYALQCMDAIKHKRSATVFSQELLACMDGKVSMLERPFFKKYGTILAALPSAPCRYAGVWLATREESIYRITLKLNSSFVAEPVRTLTIPAETVTGTWGTVGDKMVWLYDTGLVWPFDINPIRNETAGGFTLIEHDGARTDYQFEKTTTESCARQ